VSSYEGPERRRAQEPVPQGAMPILLLVQLVLLVALAVAAIIVLANQNSTVADNRETICGQANQTALAFREPQPGETREHFFERLRAQEFTLTNSLDLDCEQMLPGFEGRVTRALAEIERKLD
jgi:hypothetical protein